MLRYIFWLYSWRSYSISDNAYTSWSKKPTLFSPPEAKLGRFDLPKKSPIGCVDFGKWREVFKEEIYGTLGMDFLKEHVFRIDFDRAEVTFLRSVGSEPGVRIPITFESNVPQVEVVFAGLQEREKFQVDTGFVGRDGSMRAEMFDALAKRGALTLAGDSKYETASGSGSSRRGYVESISLGNHHHKRILFVRSELNSLCLYYWARYNVVTFDFPNKAIYLKQTRQKGNEDNERKGGKNRKKPGKKPGHSGFGKNREKENTVGKQGHSGFGGEEGGLTGIGRE